jgi:hypothetical protein
MPYCNAWMMMKLKGMKVPKKKKKLPAAKSAYVGSFNGVMKSMSVTGLGDGLRRDLTVRFAMTSMPRMVKAAVRIVHAKPICGISFVTMIGKMTPPSDDPEAVIPNAVARFLKNHVGRTLLAA